MTVIHTPQQRKDIIKNPKMESSIYLNFVQGREDRTILAIHTPRQQEINYQLLETSLQQIINLQGDPQYLQKLKAVATQAHEQTSRRIDMQLHSTTNIIYSHVLWLLKIPRAITTEVWTKLRIPCTQLIKIMGYRGRIRRSKRAKSTKMEEELRQYIRQHKAALCLSNKLLVIRFRIQILSRYVHSLMNCLRDEE